MAPTKIIGSRAQVMHGTAEKTSGGLTKSDLKYNKWGKIVSKVKSNQAKKDNRLADYKDNIIQEGYNRPPVWEIKQEQKSMKLKKKQNRGIGGGRNLSLSNAVKLLRKYYN